MTATVLIVDDSMMVRQQVNRALVGAGFQVLEACDGIDALAKLAASPDTSLVMLDLNMPKMDGLELLERMRAGEFARVPVVMLTTEGQPQLMQKAKALGAKGWIVKPFKCDQLVAVAHKLTRRSETPIGG